MLDTERPRFPELEWGKEFRDSLSENNIYVLYCHFPRAIKVRIAEIQALREENGTFTGNWESQLTVKTNIKLAPAKTLAANVIQLCWLFGMQPDEARKQLETFGIL